MSPFSVSNIKASSIRSRRYTRYLVRIAILLALQLNTIATRPSWQWCVHVSCHSRSRAALTNVLCLLSRSSHNFMGRSCQDLLCGHGMQIFRLQLLEDPPKGTFRLLWGWVLAWSIIGLRAQVSRWAKVIRKAYHIREGPWVPHISGETPFTLAKWLCNFIWFLPYSPSL